MTKSKAMSWMGSWNRKRKLEKKKKLRQYDKVWILVNNNESISSVQFSRSVVSDSLRPMNRSTPGLPVHHQRLEFTQTHIHRVSDAIQPSHPLSSPSPPAPSPSQHQSLFQ